MLIKTKEAKLSFKSEATIKIKKIEETIRVNSQVGNVLYKIINVLPIQVFVELE